MQTFKISNESALQEILQHLERIVRDYATKEEVAKELSILKDVVSNEIESQINHTTVNIKSNMLKQAQMTGPKLIEDSGMSAD